jgi:protein phosphatase
MSFWEKVRKFMQANDTEEPSSSPEENLKTLSATGERAEPAAGTEAATETLELEISLQSDPGMVRTNNEDRGVYKVPSDPEVAARKGTLVIVADGMGGASAGEVASEMAIRLVPELYYNSSQPPALALKEALEQANREIHRAAQADLEKRGMGTTCVAVAVVPPEVFMAYVGDSRLYLLRGDDFYQLTEDHSVVFEMVRQGILTRDQARHHEERNVLSMSMGGRPEITASFWEKPMMARAGDRFLICSDGLHDLVGDAEMQAIIADGPADAAVHSLIAAANSKGGLDNITAALIHVHTPKVQLDTDSKATREVAILSP